MVCRITPWSSDPKEKEIGHLQAKNWHIGIESAIKALYATLPPEDIEMYIEACQNNLKVADLKIYHTWLVSTHLSSEALLLNTVTVGPSCMGESHTSANQKHDSNLEGKEWGGIAYIAREIS